jgi:hypothetical protein
MALRAARDLLTFAAVGWRVDNFDFTLKKFDAIGLNHRVQRKRSSRFALAPAAMTAMDKQGFAYHAIPQ